MERSRGITATGATRVHDATHTWQLRGVEFDEGVPVQCYECDSCDEVWFV